MQCDGVLVMTFLVLVRLLKHWEKKRLVAQLNSKPTYTAPVLRFTAGYAPSFSQPLGLGWATVKYGLPSNRWPRSFVVLTSAEPCSHTGRDGFPPAGPTPPDLVPMSHTDISSGSPLPMTGNSL